MSEPSSGSPSAPGRLAEFRGIRLLNTPGEEAFDRLTRTAAAALRAPVSLITLVDEGREFLKSCVGLPEPYTKARETPLSHLCRYVVATGEPLVIEDARAHPLVPDAAVVGALRVIAYAGAPLRLRSGNVIGALCVIGPKPRRWSEEEVRILLDLAATVVREIEWRETREREAQYRALGEATSDGILAMDPESRILFANPAVQRIFGYAREELIGQPLSMLIPERFRAAHTAGVRRYLETSERSVPWTGMELPGLTKTGDEVALEISFGEYFRDGRRVFTGVVRDIGERQRAEQAVRQSEQRFRSLVAATAQIVWTTDREGMLLGEQPDWSAFTGQTTEEYQGWGWLEAVHPEDRAFTSEAWSASVAGRSHYKVLHRVRRHDGEYCHFSVHGVPVLEADGSIREWVGTHTDVTQQKRAAEEREFLINASEVLASSLDYERTLSSVASLAVQQLADWCAIDIVKDGQILRVATSHRDPAKDELAKKLQRYRLAPDAPGAAPLVIRTGKSVLYQEVPDSLFVALARNAEHLELLRSLGLRSGIVVPLVSHRTVVGAITLIAAESGRRYGPADLKLAEDLARRAAVAVDNARLLRETEEARDLMEHQATELEFQLEELQTQATRLAETQAELESANEDLQEANEALRTEISERARAQVRFRESELSYRSLWDSLTDLVYILDLDGHFLTVNDAVLQRYGYAREEILGSTAALLAAPGLVDLDRTTARIQGAVEGEPQRFEFWARTKSGEIFPKEVILTRGEYFGAPVVIAVGRDISEQKQAEQALRDSEERFRQLAENVDDVFWLYDFGEQHTIYVSPHFEAVWGLTPAAVYADSHAWTEALHPDDRARVLANMDATREQEYEIEYRIVRPDGEVRWIRDRGFPIRNRSGEVYRTAGLAEDITKEKHAEEALRESEERFRQIADNVRELFWMFTPDFSEAIYISPAYEALWGRPLESVYREPSSFLAAVHSEDLGALTSAMRRVRECPFEGVEYRITRPDGTVCWMFSRGFPVHDEWGNVTRVVGTTAEITERKQAEEELQQSEERFRTLFEQSVAGVLIHDDQGSILQVNQRFCESLGYTREELLGMQVFEVEVGTGPEEMLDAWAQMRPGAPQMIPGVQRRKDGNTFPVEAWIRRIELQGQSLILAEAHDVTERKQAETKLAAAEAHYRRLVESAPQAIYALDVEGRFIELNPAGERLLERSAEEVMGTHFSTVIAPADLEVAHDGFDRVISGEEYSIEFEERIRRPSGEERLLLVTETAIQDGGAIIGTHGIARDITEEREQQERMRLLTSALEGLKEGVSVARFDGQLIYANSTHTRLLGYDRSSGELPNSTRFIPDQEEAHRQEEIFRAVAEHGTWTGRVRRRRLSDGQIIPLEMITGRVDQEGGESVLFSIARDISEEILKEQQLRRVERLASVGTLIGGVAHELNNPLHAIRNFAELLLMEERNGEDREALEIMKREADRAAKVVSDLRLIARETQEEKTQRAPVDLNDVMRHVLKLRRYSLDTGNVEIREDLAADLPPVLANRGEIEQVVLNLVVNAEQAMQGQQGDRRLILRTRHSSRGAAIHVVDSGPGIPSRHLERIFDPFFTTKSPGEGTGLGLSLVHGIVTEHEGDIHVDSEVGKGTAFRIDLPCAPSEREPIHEQSLPLAPSRTLRILVVDDEDAVRRVSVRSLERIGHQVDAAEDGGHALRLLEQKEYDVILSDLRMPGLGGEDLFRRLKEGGQGLDRRLIFITGDVASPHAARVVAETNVPVLVKPVRLEDLIGAVERVAGERDRGSGRKR